MSDIHGAVGSYVVGALDDEEQVEFTRHLQTCELCRREVAELRETVTELGALSATPAPPSVRTGVLAAIREVRPLPPAEPEAGAPASATATPGVPVGPATDRPGSLGPATDRPGSLVPVDELALRRAQRRTRWLTALAAAAVVLAVALGGWAYTLQSQQQAQVAAERLETELLAAPDARVYRVPMNNGGQASFVVSKGLDRALFVGGQLPDVGPDRTYQLWTVQGKQTARSAGLVEGLSSVRQPVTGPVAQATSLAISVEPAGGSSTPTEELIQGIVPIV